MGGWLRAANLINDLYGRDKLEATFPWLDTRLDAARFRAAAEGAGHGLPLPGLELDAYQTPLAPPIGDHYTPPLDASASSYDFSDADVSGVKNLFAQLFPAGYDAQKQPIAEQYGPPLNPLPDNRDAEQLVRAINDQSAKTVSDVYAQSERENRATRKAIVAANSKSLSAGLTTDYAPVPLDTPPSSYAPVAQDTPTSNYAPVPQDTPTSSYLAGPPETAALRAPRPSSSLSTTGDIARLIRAMIGIPARPAEPEARPALHFERPLTAQYAAPPAYEQPAQPTGGDQYSSVVAKNIDVQVNAPPADTKTPTDGYAPPPAQGYNVAKVSMLSYPPVTSSGQNSGLELGLNFELNNGNRLKKFLG